MTEHVAELAERVKALPVEDRLRLVDLVLESMREGSLAEVEAAWNAEIEHRLAAYDRGEVAALDGEQVFARAHRAARGD